MRFPSYIHDAAVLDDRRVLVVRANPDNLQPGLLESWDVTSGTRLWQVPAPAPLTHVLAARGELAVTGDTEGTLQVWNTANGARLLAIDTQPEPNTSVGALAFLDDDHVLAGRRGGFVRWNVRDGAREKATRLTKADVMGFAVTPVGDRIIAACTDRTVKVWDAGGTRLRAMIEPKLPASTARNQALDEHAATSVCVLHDGQRIVASYGDGSLRCWDLTSGELLRKTQAVGKGPSWLLSVAASPVEDLVVAGSWDTHLWVWNLEDEPHAIAGHIGEVGPVSFLDDRRVVSVSFDQTIRVWDVTRSACERVIGEAIASSRFPPDESLW